MVKLDTNLLVQTIASMLVITNPAAAVKILVFNQAIADPPRSRVGSAARVAFGVVVVLGAAAIAGRRMLELLGIDLNAFTVVGGLVIAMMGFEMLFGGSASKAQGGDKQGVETGDALMIPLVLPLLAGPGAIATTITLAAQGGATQGMVTTLIAIAVVALFAFVGFAWLGRLADNFKPGRIAIAVRLGGLVLATIGTQMVLNGLKNFF